MVGVEDILKRDAEVISPSYTRIYPLVIERGEGVYLYDIGGEEYLDFTSLIAVSNVGHANPVVVEAIKEQAEKITHSAGTDFFNTIQVELAERLVEITPGDFEKKVFFANSGTETNECSLKLARWFTGKQNFIGFYGAFHGRTFGSLTLTSSNPLHRQGFHPLLPGAIHVPYAYCYRCQCHKDYPECELDCLSFIREVIFERHTSPEDIAGIIVEPIQGESGYIVPPKEFLKGLEKIANENNIIFIVDEIQTGFARSGRFFASEHFEIQPDIINLAKGIAGGLPMGACVADKEIMSWPSGAHASTFAGNPISCASSLAVIDFIEKHKLWKNAEKQGLFGINYLKDSVEGEQIEIIGDVRGLGLMIAVELAGDVRSARAENKRKKILFKAFERGLLLLPGGRSTIRIAPPLIIQEDEFEKGLEILMDVIKEVDSE